MQKDTNGRFHRRRRAPLSRTCSITLRNIERALERSSRRHISITRPVSCMVLRQRPIPYQLFTVRCSWSASKSFSTAHYLTEVHAVEHSVHAQKARCPARTGDKAQSMRRSCPVRWVRFNRFLPAGDRRPCSSTWREQLALMRMRMQSGPAALVSPSAARAPFAAAGKSGLS